MRTLFVCLNFKGPDLAAEEKNYLEHHVALARRLPGLRQYLTGKLRPLGNAAPQYYRAALLTFDDAASMNDALNNSPVAEPLATDIREHFQDLRMLAMDSQVMVPLKGVTPGQELLMAIGELDFKTNGKDLAAADKHYMEYHAVRSCTFPGLRSYIVGRLVESAGVKPDCLRAAIVMYDNFDAMRAAFRSPVALEMRKDSEANIVSVRAWQIDARLEL